MIKVESLRQLEEIILSGDGNSVKFYTVVGGKYIPLSFVQLFRTSLGDFMKYIRQGEVFVEYD